HFSFHRISLLLWNADGLTGDTGQGIRTLNSACISAAWYPDRAGMEELLRRHRSVLFKDHTVLHHELHIAQRVNVSERIARDGDQIGVSLPSWLRRNRTSETGITCLMVIWSSTNSTRSTTRRRIFCFVSKLGLSSAALILRQNSSTVVVNAVCRCCSCCRCL